MTRLPCYVSRREDRTTISSIELQQKAQHGAGLSCLLIARSSQFSYLAYRQQPVDQNHILLLRLAE